MQMSEAVNPRYLSERYLLEFVREKLNITDEDMKHPSRVKGIVRDSKLNEILTTK